MLHAPAHGRAAAAAGSRGGGNSSSCSSSTSCIRRSCIRRGGAISGAGAIRRSLRTASSEQQQQPSNCLAAAAAGAEEEGSSSNTITSTTASTSPDQYPPGAHALLAVTLPILHVLAAVLGLIGRGVDAARHAVAAAFPQMEGVSRQDVRDSLCGLAGNVRLLAVIAPLARAASSESLTAVYARTFERAAFGFAKMYLFCLFMRVLLSWFPEIDWNAQPWTFLRLITEPYLQIYRGLLPPLFGQLDFTPLFGFLILQDVVEVMAPTYTMGLHDHDTSTRWTTSDAMCYLDGF